MEPLIRMVEACFEEDVDIQDMSMLNVEKKAGRIDMDGKDSTMEESIGQSDAYNIASGENDELSEDIATKAISKRMK